MSRIAIVGAGIAGLSLAHALKARAASDVEIVVFEKSGRAGGNIRSERIGGYLCEAGPNGFLDSVPDTLDLVRALGLDGQVQVSSDAARRRFLFRRGRLHEMPSTPLAFARSGLLSWPGKLRMLVEPFARPRPDGDESIHGFASRRIGREAADVLVDSMVSGVYAGDAHRLSLRACFPKMHDMESEFGGLFRAMIALRRRRRQTAAGTRPHAPMGAPGGTLTSFKGGMEVLAAALARDLGGSLLLNRRVLGIHEQPSSSPCGGTVREPLSPCGSDPARSQRPFRLLLNGARTVDADVVVLSGPACESADIAADLDRELAGELAAIHTAPLVVVALGYEAAAVAAARGPLDGFGYLIPRSERTSLLGVLWDSSIYPGRAPAGRVLLRAMIGGATNPGAVDVPDEVLLMHLRRELAQTMGLDVAPSLVHIVRHRGGIPQYTIGHLARLARIDGRLARHPGLYVAGNSYRGAAINSCVADARELAGRILSTIGPAACTTPTAD